MPAPPALAVVIVNFNGGSCLRDAVEALARVAPAGTEVAVVDNASVDGSVAALEAALAEGAGEGLAVHVVANVENRGFAAGCNQGIAATSGHHVLLLNNDVTLPPGTLEALTAVLEAEPSAAGATPRLLTPAGRDQLPDLGRSVLGRPGRRRASGGVRVTWAPCACLLLRREALAAVGGLDEGFFFYNEDLDLAKRLKAAGWQLLLVPDAAVTHLEGVSTDSVPGSRERTILEGYRGGLRLIGKHHATLFPLARAGMALEVRLRAIALRIGARLGRELTGKQAAYLAAAPRILATLREAQGPGSTGS